MEDKLGDRMKMYEQAKAGERLMPLLPICARIDGKCFSNFTSKFERPFDSRFHDVMKYTTEMLVKETNALVGYTQSDEISLVFYSDKFQSQVFFDGKLQKMVSVLASYATAYFREGLTKFMPENSNKMGFFDCRVWNVPNLAEASNTILWRELDATKNSISMAARHYFSHKSLQGKTGSEMQEKLFSEKGINWNDYPDSFKRGSYFMRIQEKTKFTSSEIEKLPLKHEARNNPDLEILRTVVKEVVFPPMTRIRNREETLFFGATPIVGDNDERVD